MYRHHFRKRVLLLRPSHLEQALLPPVVGLLANAVFLAPVLYILAAAPTLRDPPRPQGQFILTVECL